MTRSALSFWALNSFLGSKAEARVETEEHKQKLASEVLLSDHAASWVVELELRIMGDCMAATSREGAQRPSHAIPMQVR